MHALAPIVGLTALGYVVALYVVSWFANRRVHDVEDFVVAGRRLPLHLASATLLATWFGAGTLMAAADEIRDKGLRAAALDPLGAGLCLIAFGIFFARPLWEARLLTLPELFGRRFGAGARAFAAVLMVPPYLGWVAAQFMALAGIAGLFFDAPQGVSLFVIAGVSIGYTVLGGMWAVTLTDALQLVLVIVGLAILSVDVLAQVGGFGGLWTRVPIQSQVLVPTENITELVGWVGVVAAGALGNIPSQDVSQRVFAARSSAVARWACFLAGGAYLMMGVVPVLLGLAGGVLLGEGSDATIPALAALHMDPVLAVIFVVTLMSVILSTIDSALLAPSTVLVHDLAGRYGQQREGRTPSLRPYRLAICAVGLASLGLAWAGESAYGLLESSYELGMVSLMAPLAFAVYARRLSARGALASMIVGTLVWVLHKALGVETFAGVEGVPLGLCAMGLSCLAYPLLARFDPRAHGRAHGEE